VNVWTAEEAGAEVIGPHVETDDQAAGHEELYLVLAGRARFRIGADEVDAPSGTFVAVTDPAARRGALALEPGTSVLAVGGVPRERYRVAAWEFVVRALARYREGDFEGAIQELEPALERHPDSATVHYDLACYASLAGDERRAVGHLRRALSLDPALLEQARREPDFEPIRNRVEFHELIGP
jgi:tetratricopeptide (TPR) repeat protein